MGIDSPANIEHIKDAQAQVEKAPQQEAEVLKLIEGLNGSTIDETSGASEIDLNGVKFKLEPGVGDFVIANVTEADGSVKSVVLKKDQSGKDNVWSAAKGMDAEMVRGAKDNAKKFASNQ
jgi:hypothetical protein